MQRVKHPFKLSFLQANLISLLIVSAAATTLLVIGIGYRDSRLGLYAVGGMAAAGLAGAMLFRPRLGTYILTMTIFTNVSSVLSDQGLPGVNKPLVALAFVSVMAAYFSHQKWAIRLKPVEWLMLAYGGVWLASYFVAKDQYASVDQIVVIAKAFVILLVVVYSIQSQASWKWAIWLIILSTTLLAALSSYQVITGSFDQTFWGLATVTPDATQMRLSGPVGDPNFYGQILAAGLPLALYRTIDERERVLKWIAGGSAILLVFAILNTYSRGAFLAMVVTLVLIAIERRVKPTFLIWVALATFVVVRSWPIGLTERIETLSILVSRDDAAVRSEGSFRGRTSEMVSGLHMFTEHPLLGVGIGNYETHYQDYASRLGLEQRTEDRQAHSLYLEVAAETGLLGLLALGSLFVGLLIGFAQARRKSRTLDRRSDWPTWITSLQMSLCSYLVTSTFLHGDYIRYLFFLIALGAAAIHLSDHLPESGHPRLSEMGVGNP